MYGNFFFQIEVQLSLKNAQFSFWILIALAKTYLFHMVINRTRVPFN